MAKKGSKKKSKQRPPVVVVLGHIDHGKTSLLSKIREEAMPKEAGEITQSIGAYQAQYSNQRITFIDTPGHRAFSSMRSRGAKGADVAVLVVAANEGPKAQTKEAAKIAQKAGVPLILAWNKMDLSSAKPSRFNNKIKDLNLSKSLSVEVSAKTGQGIDELLEAILLQAQEMDLPFKKGGLPKFTILESQVHPQKGILLDIVLKQGEIVLGQEVDGFEGAVRKILDFTGSPVKKVLPGMPARLMGLKEVSEKKVAQKTQSESREDQLSIIVKANSQGALQALVYSLEGKEKINLLDSGLGPISEKDLLKLKSGDWAVGFQVGIESSARNLAERKQINLETYKVIYDLLKDAQKQAQQIGKKEEKKERQELGEVEIIATFKNLSDGMIVGGPVKMGQAVLGVQADIIRNGKKVGQGKIKHLEHRKKEMAEVEEGQEAGIYFKGSKKIKVGDILKIWQME